VSLALLQPVAAPACQVAEQKLEKKVCELPQLKCCRAASVEVVRAEAGAAAEARHLGAGGAAAAAAAAAAAGVLQISSCRKCTGVQQQQECSSKGSAASWGWRSSSSSSYEHSFLLEWSRTFLTTEDAARSHRWFLSLVFYLSCGFCAAVPAQAWAAGAAAKALPLSHHKYGCGLQLKLWGGH